MNLLKKFVRNDNADLGEEYDDDMYVMPEDLRMEMPEADTNANVSAINTQAQAAPAAPARLWAPGSGIKGLDAEQGHKGAGAERTGGVEVGVVRRPASHDLLIVHQGVTGAAQRAARQQNLWAKGPRKQAPFGLRAREPLLLTQA